MVRKRKAHIMSNRIKPTDYLIGTKGLLWISTHRRSRGCCYIWILLFIVKWFIWVIINNCLLQEIINSGCWRLQQMTWGFQVAYPTSVVTKHFVLFFAANGLPKVLVSYNGSCFTSQEFSQFWRGCWHKTEVHCSVSSGQGERSVKTIKNALNNALLINNNNVHQALITFLFAYRRTPHTTTAAKLFIGRELRSRLDMISPDHMKNKDKTLNIETYRKLDERDRVSVHLYGVNKWRFGVVSKKLGSLHY